MPLEILLILVIGGIGAIALLLWLTGLGAQKVLTEEETLSEWARHYPDDQVKSVWLTHDCHAALVVTETKPGLLWVLGADTVARHLFDFDMIDDTRGLSIDFHDYTAPTVRLTLDEDERVVWKNLITPQ